ncbi:hypothetical protein K2173_011933 [Erythroxylum novogranatense]|uniref:Glutamate receptor n=1 Tax=Erythroxylum novogranatense TaxID=1862640 RepID=A0AAV8TEW1_9ROSI|nr:hypothetical protein K2173_011933 [Erythroxylum novogranatense]
MHTKFKANMGSSFSSLLAFLLAFSHISGANASGSFVESKHSKHILGAIVDNSSRSGKEIGVSLQMALEDANKLSNQNLILHIRNSNGDPLEATAAAQALIKQGVKLIIGPLTWEETSLVAEVGSGNQIPVFSSVESAPSWAFERWPFLVQASPNKHAQMKAVAAILKSWEWTQVNVIHEDTDFSVTGIMPHLSEALKEANVEVSDVLTLPPFDSSSVSKELERLKGSQCRVFVVHLSFPLAVRFFERAKQMKMMEKDYVWITTDGFTNLVYSFNKSILSSTQGILGIKDHFPENEPHLQSFGKRFSRRFSLEYPEEYNYDPGIYAVQAYDALSTVALAMRQNERKGQDLLHKILHTTFDGLTGKIQFINQKLPPMQTFQIINVIGNGYQEIGFWSDGFGFSDTVNSNVTSNSSMKALVQVIWPGGSSSTPQGWTVSTNSKPLMIGVPNGSIFKQFVGVDYDFTRNVTTFRGYAIELFKAVREELPFDLPYQFVPSNDTYTRLVEQIHLKKFDAVVGDISIVSTRLQFADFTHPYTEAELVMIVPVRSKLGNKAWLFARPYTRSMWMLIFIMNLYNGFVVWLIERDHCSELRGSVLNQMGTLSWLSFSTLFSFHGSKLRSNLSRMAILVWLFWALVITQTYTANLSSILTVPQLEPTVDSIESLQSNNAVIGHFKISYVANYLEDVYKFNPKNIRNYTSPEDCIKDLRNKEIAAVFVAKPWAKILMARYCRGFTIAKPSVKIGGFAFAFPKGSPLLRPVTDALVRVSESGRQEELEKQMFASQKCVDLEQDDNSSLNVGSFWMLFVFTGSASTVALIIYIIRKLKQPMLVHRVRRQRTRSGIKVAKNHTSSSRIIYSKSSIKCIV